MFYITVELVFKSYMPKKLEKGMFFLNPQENPVWVLDRNIHPDEKEQFLIDHGAPVEPYLVLIDDNGEQEIIATPNQIGWWDDGPDYDELRDVDIKDFNGIIDLYEGKVDVQLETEPEDNDFVKQHILMAEGKVVMSVASDWEFDSDEVEDLIDKSGFHEWDDDIEG